MITLKTFQSETVDSAVELFVEMTRMLKVATNENERKLIKSHNGCLLIEAPTGSGKTLMAGHIVERMNRKTNVVWFWFAPFAGIVGQSVNTIRSDFSGIQVRDIKADRILAQSKSGDIFVTTWASVAVKHTEIRKVRSDTEQMPSLDIFIEALKIANYSIGVVIDEAHHGFQKAREALSFYRDVLSPDFTLLITATPDDQDIQKFKTATGIAELHKITVSREDCVDAGLVKKGLKAIAFLADESTKSITDYEKTALRYGVEIHKKIEQTLIDNEIQLTPLMLVQVDSRVGSIEDAKKSLVELGINEDNIAIHTSDEPDANILAIANDQNVHALIFKMAVALGFDAPRAFTLVSLRKVRDADFGVQVVGRILRVHRQLQGKDLPNILNYGYVALADYPSQEGLSVAAERVNKIKTDLSGLTPSYRIALIPLGNNNPSVQFLGNKNQPSLFPGRLEPTLPNPVNLSSNTTEQQLTNTQPGQQNFWDFITQDNTNPNPNPNPNQNETSHQLEQGPTIIQSGSSEYSLRQDILFPLTFKKECYPLDATEDIINLVVSNFRLDTTILAATLRQTVSVIKREVDVFSHDRTTVSDQAYADISDQAISKKVQLILFENNYIDGRQLYLLLRERVEKEILHLGWKKFDNEEQATRGLDRIVAAYPGLIRESIKLSLNNYLLSIDGEPLPQKIYSDIPLPPARLNLYRIFPRKLNTWEKSFADILDNDTSGTVLWWHRNGDSGHEKAYSASCSIPGRNAFYPDFIVGVKGRHTENNILLIEIKESINREDSIYKARAEHKNYKRVMTLTKKDDGWYIVINDKTGEHNIIDRPYRIDSMLGW